MLKEKMLEMAKESEGIQLFVLNDILDYGDEDEDIKGYIENVLNYGCVSGCVSSLIYYRDTDKFFHKYSDEILALLNKLNIEFGISFKINSNNLAWFGYEETLKNIASELGIY